MGAIGRNDPCPCGSGRKYKKCCLEKDEAEAATDRAEAAAAEKREQERVERFQEVVVEGPLDEALAEARAMLEWSDLDGEWAFEIVEELGDRLVAAGRREELDALIAEIERRHPEAFAEEAGWLLRRRVALAIEKGEDPSELLATLAEAPIDDISGAVAVVALLSFHGRGAEALELLDELCAAADELEDSDEGEEEDEARSDALAVLRLAAMMNEQLDHPGEIEPLLEAAGEFDYPAHQIEEMLARRAGTAPRVEELEALFTEFAGALHLRHGWSTARTGMAGQLLLQLAPSPSKAGRRRPRPAPPLLPDLRAVERLILDEEVQPAHPEAALALALLRWPEWLVGEKLVDEGAARAWRAELLPVLERVTEKLVAWDPPMLAEVRAALAGG